MAETKKISRAQHRGHEKEVEKSAKSADNKKNQYAYMAVAVVVLAAIALFVLKGPSLNASVPFSTFKAGFQSAARVSIVATYSNQSQYATENPCFTSIVEVVSYTRKPSTIDFFLINQQNATCTYSSTGLGGSIQPATANSSYCLGIADSEPAIFLNYSAYNSTSVATSHLTAYGNSQYMNKCPIAVELN